MCRNSQCPIITLIFHSCFYFENSDHFINQQIKVKPDRLDQLGTHGLLGQTWNPMEYKNSAIKYILGEVDDYVIMDSNDILFGIQFVYNLFSYRQSK